MSATVRRCGACGKPRGEEFWGCVQWCNACLDEYAAQKGPPHIERFIAEKRAEYAAFNDEASTP